MQVPLTTVGVVQKAMGMVAAVNQQIALAAGLDEQPRDRLKGRAGEVDYQDADATIRLSIDPHDGSPTRFESRVLRDVASPEGVSLPAGTSTSFQHDANGVETFENRLPQTNGQTVVQSLKIDAQQGLLDYNEFLTAG